jgi:hypothetical protein
VDNFSDSTDKQILEHLGVQGTELVDILALPVKLLDHLDVQTLVH